MIQNIKAFLPSFLHNGEKKEQASVSSGNSSHLTCTMTFNHDPFPMVHCLWRGQKVHLTVISVSISASWQAQLTVSLFPRVPAFFWVSGFCCYVAVQHQSSTDSLARSVSTHSAWLHSEHYRIILRLMSYSSYTPGWSTQILLCLACSSAAR